MASNTEDVVKLSALFDEALGLYNQIVNSQEATNSPSMQLDVKRDIKMFEMATRLVSMSDIFSKNEGIEEVATNDLQYFLLPALLGSLSLKLTSGERKDIVDCAEVYFKDFLKRCTEYNLCNYNIKEKKSDENDVSNKTELDQIVDAVSTRANKIQRFKENQELKAKLSDLKKNMENENVDDEVKRNYYLTMIRLFILEAEEELSSIDMEKPILEHMAKMKSEDGTSKRPMPPRPAPLKPIIITKDEVQKAVFGAGYPSLPTMTVQEFYDKRVADGVFPDPSKKSSQPMSLQEAAAAGIELYNEDAEAEENEKKIEADDDENIQRLRAKDEFKDDHRRGWGNRMNRS